MAVVYWVSLLLGGAFLLPTVFGGDLDVDTDVDVDVDADADADAENDGGGGSLWLSMRFWTFFDAFFGLTGVALGWAGLGPWLTAAAALSTGFVSATAVSVLLRRLKRARVNSQVSEVDLVGERGTVLLPVGPDARGKVRLSLKGRDLEVLAHSVETDFGVGSRVRVQQVEGDGTVRVVPVSSW